SGRRADRRGIRDPHRRRRGRPARQPLRDPHAAVYKERRRTPGGQAVHPVPDLPTAIRRARMGWKAIHRWLGLVAGGVALVLGITGAVLALDPVQQAWRAPAAPADLPVARLAE